MTRFSRCLLVGASGGIGAALADALRARGVEVVGLSRTSQPALDLGDEDSIRAAIARLDGPFDLVLVTTGLLHEADLPPEKSWKQLAKPALDRNFAINATGPALVLKYALPLVPRDRPALLAALGARVGSIGDNRLGGWYAYRASKAALAMLVKCFAIDLARTHKQLAVVALHPGTVDTGLSAPFQGNVPDGKLFSPAASAAYLLDVIEQLGPGDSGGHFDWKGERIAP